MVSSSLGGTSTHWDAFLQCFHSKGPRAPMGASILCLFLCNIPQRPLPITLKPLQASPNPHMPALVTTKPPPNPPSRATSPEVQHPHRSAQPGHQV